MSTQPPNTTAFHSLRLTGDWQVHSISYTTDTAFPLPAGETRSLPEVGHLQPLLYPEDPYWGAGLRAINEHSWIYRRTISAPLLPYKRAHLRFEGIDHFADVWLNEHYLGHHEGHFAPFEFDVTESIAPENELVVRVSSPWDVPNPKGSYPTDHVIRGLVKGLYEHGEGVIPPNVNPLGIWRRVYLLLDQGISLDHVRIRTQLDGAVQLALTVNNATNVAWSGDLAHTIDPDNHEGASVQVSIPVELSPGRQTIEHTLLVPDPHLWWPWDQGLPSLYRLTTELQTKSGEVLSQKVETFGIRTVKLKRSPERFTYFINDRPVFIRGSAYIPGLYLSQCDRDFLACDVNLARETNLNLLRVHCHVSPPELYDICDRAGMLVWQDFELSWIHDPSPEFETRARALQRDMITGLGNHPSIITWACHNEPTMLFTRRQNLETHPDPALYADALALDPTRPVFICSGQMEKDWERAGDAHTYYGAIWSQRYTDVYQHHYRLNTEFGFEAPAALQTLQKYPACWERLKHLDGQIETLWDYQAELIQFHVEHLRRLRATCSAGFVHFWLADLLPQVGCGVVDADRLPKGGYEALRRASQPLQIALEHDGRRPRALWVFNDMPQAYPGAIVRWKVQNAEGQCVLQGQTEWNIAANASQQILPISWVFPREVYAVVELLLIQSDGTVLARNEYHHPFQPTPRPRGYPWKFDPFLGVKVFDRPDAPSLAGQTGNGIIQRVPLGLREKIAEWALRQQLPPRVLSVLARLTAPLLGG